MCNSCAGDGLRRREFLALNGAMGASVLLSSLMADRTPAAETAMAPVAKKRPRVLAAFLYPPADVVNEGKMEDSWAPNHWFTWPGNQFQPEAQQQKFTARIRELGESLGIDIEFTPRAIYQQSKVTEFIAQAKQSAPDAVLIVNFWNTLSKWAFQMATESAPTAIVYHSVGSNHQLPPESLRLAEGLYYIHSIENFDTSENRYFGAHCTCALKLHGPQGQSQPFAVRPFFHQLPKTAALDVQWTPNEPILVTKYQTGKDTLSCWRGKVIESPASPPTGGCATRVLMEIDGVPDVCGIYSGAHPILFCGDRGDARRFKAFARMYRLKLEGNV